MATPYSPCLHGFGGDVAVGAGAGEAIVGATARTVVFVEVKTRTSDQFGGLAQAVTAEKLRRLRRLAALWLSHQDARWAAIRIDVIGARIGRRRTPEIAHLEAIG
jgi:putative endonuclease